MTWIQRFEFVCSLFCLSRLIIADFYPFPFVPVLWRQSCLCVCYLCQVLSSPSQCNFLFYCDSILSQVLCVPFNFPCLVIPDLLPVYFPPVSHLPSLPAVYLLSVSPCSLSCCIRMLCVFACVLCFSSSFQVPIALKCCIRSGNTN